MFGILKKIVSYKKSFIKDKLSYYKKIKSKIKIPGRKKYSFINTLKKNKFSLIAEIKKGSPSAGIINKNFDVEKIAGCYQEDSFINAVSILTDEKYFYGSINDFQTARSIIKKPLLRKDFIISKYQIYETKFINADILLLIANILTKKQLNEFYHLAKELKLECLIEVHNEKEIDKVYSTINPKIIGVNNRNLEDFTVDINTTFRLQNYINELNKKPYIISESGISKKSQIKKLISNNISGALIGTSIMKEKNINNKLKKLFL